MGLYLHIPFCARKCPYCDFYSVEQSALIDEIDIRIDRWTPLFVGGGTPSLLSPRQWDRLLRGVSRTFACRGTWR